MKKVLLAAVAMIASVCAGAQTPEKGAFMVRPMFGLSSSSFNIDTKYSGLRIDSRFRYGFVGGVEMAYQANRLFQPSLGLFYAQQGNKYIVDVWDKDLLVEMDYLTMPVLGHFYVYDGIALSVGVQPCVLLNSKCDGSVATDFQLQIPFGISYEYSHFVFDAKMTIGITKCFDKDHVKYYADGATNEGFTLTVGYNFEM